MTTKSSELGECSVLQGLNAEYVALLEKGAEKKALVAGEILIRQGDPANRMFLLQTGKMALEWHRAGQKDIQVHIAGPGELVGWSWLFPPFLSHFQARVLEPGNAYLLNAGSLLAACERNCRFGLELMKRVARVVIDRLQSARKRSMAGNNPGLAEPERFKKDHDGNFKAGPLKELLGAHPFLHGMSAQHLQTLSDCAMEVGFAQGETVFKTGDLANRFYLILDGQIALETRQNGASQRVQVLHGGDVLGWSWLYEPYQWQFDARAEKRTRTVFIYATRLRELCEADPCLGFDLLKRVTRVVIQRLEAVCETLSAEAAR